MSEIKNSDVLAYFVPKESSDPIKAESLSSLDSNDNLLMNGFVAGRFFTADTFTFGMTLGDDEGGNPLNPDDGRSYSRWRSLKVGQNVPTPPFRADPEDFSITRMIDSSSPILLSHCLRKESFKTAVVVKRARIGTSGLFSAILRLEFSTVWIKTIEWEDNDAITESVRFKYNKVDIVYVKRRPDGTVASQWPCNWTTLGYKPANGAR